jgi:penicillin-insensitive murein endopeptidase
MRHLLAVSLAGLFLGGCARAPSPLAPHWAGSIGMPHRGVLTRAVELPAQGAGFRVLTANERHFGTPRFVATLTRAAARVHEQRPGGALTIGDLSAKTGGKISSHASHRTGRDADLLLYMTTLEGAPVSVTGFVHVGKDGLAWDEAGQRFLRFDVERQWLLVKALVEDPDARVQWLFASRPVGAMLLEWARARGESGETLVRAMDTLLEPGAPAQSHDDHIHIRIACNAEEIALGCEPHGPTRPWNALTVASGGTTAHDDAPSTFELVELLVMPIQPLDPPLAAGGPDGPKPRRP